jgi:hypothetical protein
VRVGQRCERRAQRARFRARCHRPPSGTTRISWDETAKCSAQNAPLARVQGRKGRCKVRGVDEATQLCRALTCGTCALTRGSGLTDDRLLQTDISRRHAAERSRTARSQGQAAAGARAPLVRLRILSCHTHHHTPYTHTYSTTHNTHTPPHLYKTITTTPHVPTHPPAWCMHRR